MTKASERPHRHPRDFRMPRPKGWGTVGLGQRSMTQMPGAVPAAGGVGFDNVFRMGLGLMLGVGLARVLLGDHWFSALWFGLSMGFVLSIPLAIVVLRIKRELRGLGTIAFVVAFFVSMLIELLNA